MSKNRRIALVFGGFVTAVAAAFYPIFFYPLTHKDEYRYVQKTNRTGIDQADIQPVDGLAQYYGAPEWCEGMVRSIQACRQMMISDG